MGEYKGERGAELLAVSPDGQLVAVSEQLAGSVTIWKVTSGEAVVTLAGTAGVAAFSPDGKSVAVCEGLTAAWVASAGLVHVFDLKTGKETRTLRGHKAAITAIAFSPDGKRLATGSWDSSAIVWDLTAKP